MTTSVRAAGRSGGSGRPGAPPAGPSPGLGGLACHLLRPQSVQLTALPKFTLPCILTLCHQRVSAACRAPTCRIPYLGVPCVVSGFPDTILLCHSSLEFVRTRSAAIRMLAQDFRSPTFVSALTFPASAAGRSCGSGCSGARLAGPLPGRVGLPVSTQSLCRRCMHVHCFTVVFCVSARLTPVRFCSLGLRHVFCYRWVMLCAGTRWWSARA
jgi:hypothetical protein